MKKWWIIWYSPSSYGAFTLMLPWWLISLDYRNYKMFAAAVLAKDENSAKEIIYKAYDVRPEKIEFRTCGERPNAWSPYNPKFQKQSWMKDF